MLSRSLKLATYALIAHAVLFTLMKLDQGGAYGMGAATGRVIWMGILVYAIRRLLKHTWPVSLIVIALSLVNEVSAFSKGLAALPPGDPRAAASWILFILVNSPLLAALLLLLPESSRAPFKNKAAVPAGATPEQPTTDR